MSHDLESPDPSRKGSGMKQAKIKCPCCGTQITVRAKDISEVDPATTAKIWAAADEMFAAMDRGFKKMFHPSLWK